MAKLAKDLSWNNFQLLCKDILIIKYGERFEEYGRTGQSQKGIDILATNPNSSYLRKVAQCKFYTDNTSSIVNSFLEQIRKDYNTACQHFAISEFIIITALNRDVKIQDEIYKFSNKSYPITIWFWDDIEQIVLYEAGGTLLHYFNYLTPQEKSQMELCNQSFKNDLDQWLTINNIQDILEKFKVENLKNIKPDDLLETMLKVDECYNEFYIMLEAHKSNNKMVSAELISISSLFADNFNNLFAFLALNCIYNCNDKSVEQELNLFKLIDYTQLSEQLISSYNNLLKFIKPFEAFQFYK